jgi:Arc/MetJ family transcription regulator
MTATIELDDLMVSEAKELSGISDDKELVNMTIDNFVKGQKRLRSMIEARESIKENPFWDDYDPRA